MRNSAGGAGPVRGGDAAVLAAVRQLLTDGDPLTLRRVARSSGLTARAVRSCFATVELMVEAVALEIMQRLTRRSVASDQVSAEAEWAGLMRAVWHEVALVRAVLVFAAASRDPALRDLLQPLLWSKSSIIARGQEQGCFRADRSADSLAAETQRLCLSALLGAGETVESATGTTLRMLRPDPIASTAS